MSLHFNLKTNWILIYVNAIQSRFVSPTLEKRKIVILARKSVSCSDKPDDNFDLNDKNQDNVIGDAL